MRYGKGLSVAAILLALGFVMACSDDTAAVGTEPEASGTAQGGSATNPAPAADYRPEGVDTAIPASPEATIPADGTAKKEEIEVASPDAKAEDAAPKTKPETETSSGEQDRVSPAETRQSFNKRNYDVNETFDAKRSTLMGLDTQSDLDAVHTRFGKPAETYSLPDDTSNATVYAYPGFAIGISNGTVLFVEVNSSAINPGLNGFRVGGTVDEAIAAIGKPSSQTDYVLAYNNNGVILKLDVDPKNKQIQSVKLFPEE
ncbi:hypothetical protein [Paenibacillus alkalitolerans]|uniref:hypothetical protein n=1 Tax=Paenibacillus alkalitolerans TaxID=2799335 RepID=UPI0018F70E32|nr:hypothetical protein [Paenibacillus alkalitolerans]